MTTQHLNNFYWNKRELQGLFEKISSKFLTLRVWKHQFFMKLLLQMHPKTFLEVVRRHPRYLEGPPTSGLYNAPTPMVIRPTNHFLFKKKVTPPVARCFGNRFFIFEFWVLDFPNEFSCISRGFSKPDFLHFTRKLSWILSWFSFWHWRMYCWDDIERM